MKQNYCIITYTDPFYLVGTKVALHTLIGRNKIAPEVICLLDQEHADLQTDPLLKKLVSKFVLIDEGKYKSIEPIQNRFRKCFYKYEAFNDYGFDQNVWIDSDTVTLKDTPMLFAPNKYDLMAIGDHGMVERSPGAGLINSGVMVIGKKLQGEKVVKELIDFTAKQQDIEKQNGKPQLMQSVDGGDQAMLNLWLKQKPNIKLGSCHKNTIY